jgi:hypothetical protein
MLRCKLRTLMIVLALGPMVLAGGCSRPGTSSLPARKPFRASAEREAAILRSYVEVKPEMPIAEVQRLLGSPDRVLPVYEPRIKNPKRLGSTSWYVIEENNDAPQSFEGVRFAFDHAGLQSLIDRLINCADRASDAGFVFSEQQLHAFAEGLQKLR